jgi:hypothetical protein
MMTCKICRHASRAEIDKAILEGGSVRDIARRFALTKDSLHRHKQNHLSDQLAKTQATRRQTVVAQVHDVKDRVLRLLDLAEQKGNPGAFLAAARELRGFADLILGLEERAQGLQSGPPIQRFTIVYGLEGVKLAALRIVDVDQNDLTKARSILADLAAETQEPARSCATLPQERRYADEPSAPQPEPKPKPARPAAKPSVASSTNAEAVGWNEWLTGDGKL